MAETAQIAKIAQIVSDDIFLLFGWNRAGTTDHNFKGAAMKQIAEPTDMDDEESEATTPTQKAPPQTRSVELKDYPADVVFYYEDPYFHLRNYIHFDLKSYSSTTLKHAKVVKALRSLSQVIAIAELSEDWSRKFAPQQSNYRIHGGLFIYNHDNLDRGRFNDFFLKLGANSARVPEGKNVYVFSPERITYLLSILNDMKVMCFEGTLPRKNEGEILYYYPYGAKMKPQNNLLKYATAEMLLGPILIMRYRFNDPSKSPGYVVYYNGPGAEIDEFIYIFEMLLKRRLLTDIDALHLRLQSPAENAYVVFKAAKEEFIKAYHDLDSFRKQVDQINFGRGAKIQLEFSTVDLGME